MTQHERDCLNDALEREQNPRCGLRTLSEIAHEIGVGKVVDIGDQHRDRGGDPELDDQPRDGCFRHFLIISVGGGQGLVLLLRRILQKAIVAHFSANFYTIL